MSQVQYQSLLTHRLLPKKQEPQDVRRSVNMPSKMATKELGSAFSPNFLACVRAPSGISRQLIRWLKVQKNQAQPLPQHFHVSQGILEFDEKFFRFLRAVRSKGGVVKYSRSTCCNHCLIASNPSTSQQLINFDMPRSWVQSIYHHMGYVKRMGTTSRPPLPQGSYDECRVSYLRDIDTKRKKYNISPKLIINADQTPSSYVSVGRATMSQHGSNSVAVKGLTDKSSNICHHFSW